MRIVHGDDVFEELVDISFFIAQENEDAAQRFLAACDETFTFLAGNKDIGTARSFRDPDLSGVRMWRVKGFENYLIFYRSSADSITILHVVHCARNYGLLFGGE